MASASSRGKRVSALATSLVCKDVRTRTICESMCAYTGETALEASDGAQKGANEVRPLERVVRRCPCESID